MSSPYQPYVPRLVRAWSEEPGPRAREVDGSLVSVDISGFTALAERLAVHGKAGGEELVQRISSVFGGLIAVADRHGGDVLKFRGDALLLFFPGDRHAERACGAASDMQWTIEEVGSTESTVGPVELRMSAGVHSGSCHFFLAETPQRELLVGGPAATRVFQLEDLASAGEIMIGADTARRVPADWLGAERDGARVMTRLEPGASAIPGPPDAPGRELDLFVPPSLRAHITSGGGAPEHRNVTVAFVKLSGTDELLESAGPDALLEQIDILAAGVSDAASSYGITWLESDIDSGAVKLYLTAGAPLSTGEDAEGMLRAVRQIVAVETALPIRAGINRGHVFTGDIGGESRRTYAVMGDAVNLAARLTARADAGDVLATAAVLDRARTLYATDREPFLVKGKERAVMAHHVGEATGRRDASQVDTIPVLGRDAELSALSAAIDGARLRQLQAVELVGEPGLGKSRLVRELKTKALGFQQLAAVVDPYAAGEPYSIWPELLRPLAGITPDRSRDEAGELLSAFVNAVMPDLAPWLPLLAAPFGATVAPTPESVALTSEQSRERLHTAVTTLLERILMMPTLIAVEDAHWLDDASLLLLRQLVAAPAPRPWFVCVTARPGAASILTPGGPGERIELQPLDDATADAFALAVAQEHALSTDALETLAARAGGNPLFLRELVFAAQHRQNGDLPDSVESLLTTRIDTLEPPDRLLLRYASVIGSTFDPLLLAEIVADELPAAADRARWDGLDEFVVPVGEGGLAFRHDLMRATAYEGLAFERRREIHGAVGLALEARAGDRADEEAALLSLHFAEAGDYERAWHYSAAAGRRAKSGFANIVAAELFERALSAADSLDAIPARDVAEVAEALGDVCERFGSYERAESAYVRVLELLAGDLAVETRIASKRGLLRERTAEYAEAREMYEAGLAAVGPDGETGELARNRTELEIGIAGIVYRQGQLAEAITLTTSAAERAERTGDRGRLAHALYLSALAHTDLGRIEGIELCERALPIYEALSDLGGVGRTLNNLGIALYYQGRWDEATAAYRRGREALERWGDVIEESTLANNEGEILSDQGHLADAEDAFQGCLRTYRAAGYAVGEAVVLNNLARCASRAGRFEEAHELFAEAREIFGRIGAAGFLSESRAREGECLVFEGRYREAIDLLAGADQVEQTEATRVLSERTLGYAYHQARDANSASEHLLLSLELARKVDSEFEVALCQQALARTGNAEDATAAEAAATLERLGVEFVRPVPLP